MKVLRLAALLLTVSAVAFAGTSKTTSDVKGGYTTNGWKQCVMTCADGFRTFPSCSAPTPTCCNTANNIGCGSHGGLVDGYCTESGGSPEYCP